MREEVNLVLYHMFGRKLLYTSGLMTDRGMVDGISIREYLGKLTSKYTDSGIEKSIGSPKKTDR